MKRWFLCLLFLSLLAAPAGAAPERLVAVIMTDTVPRYRDIHAAFTASFAEHGRRDLRIYVQTPHDDLMSLRNSVRKAVALGAGLIVTYGPAATLAAVAESPAVPIVFADVYDPVRLGLVSADRQVGRRVAGVRGDAPLQTLFKYFVDVTGAAKLAILYDGTNRVANLQKALLEESAQKRGVTTIPLPVEVMEGHLATLHRLPADADGLFLADSEHPDTDLAAILTYLADRHIPVITMRSGLLESGVFMTLETDAEEQGEKLAELAGQLLAGANPAELPLVRPRRVAFAVNLKVARAYGIQVPLGTLSAAARVIR